MNNNSIKNENNLGPCRSIQSEYQRLISVLETQRKARQISNEDLSRAAGRNASYWSNVKGARGNEPGLAGVVGIADALGLNLVLVAKSETGPRPIGEIVDGVMRDIEGIKI
jgi:hypothetical protein